MERTVHIKRVYDPTETGDDYRVFIDRLWPRGVSKEELKFDLWCKDLAPSPGLRTWFGHKVEHWEKFRDRYQAELRDPEQVARMLEVIEAAGKRSITLIYGAKDTEHNHARVLADALSAVLHPGQKSTKK